MAAEQPIALFAGIAQQAHHFDGVADRLARLGWDSIRELGQARAPVVLAAEHDAGVRAVVHADACRRNATGIVRVGRRLGAPVAMVMDGVCELANTFLNADAGTSLLRPAPADVVFAAGEHDRAILEALGNRAVATGLPRFAAFEHRCQQTDVACEFDLLVACARSPSFTAASERRLAASLVEIRDAAVRRGLNVRWRISASLAARVGVEWAPAPGLEEDLLGCRAVMTTASSLLVESMLSGAPTALVHPHPWSCWLPSVWAWRPEVCDDHERERVSRLPDQAALASDAAAMTIERAGVAPERVVSDELDTVLDSLLAATESQMRGQRRLLARLHTPGGDSGVARAITEMEGLRAPTAPRVRSRNQDRIRAVSVIESHSSSIGGVSVWSEQMEAYFAARRDEGIEWGTVYLGGDLPPAAERLDDRPDAWRLELDPTDSTPARVVEIADALCERGADVVLANYSAIAHAAVPLLRSRGVRSVAIAHTDDATTRALLARSSAHDAFVGVSEACSRWISRAPGVGGAPVETIVYGVPTHPCREGGGLADGTLRLVYVGRVVEAQKRVSDLVELMRGLFARGVDARLTVIGDGPDLESLLGAFDREFGGRSCVRALGVVAPVEVQALLPGFDALVLTSEAEGTSISMLEAMGAGVMPCVTAVSSGLDGLLVDGQNAVVAPIGAMDVMADRLAELAGDASRLRAMGERARETIESKSLTEAACARRYASLLKRVQDAPMASGAGAAAALQIPGDEWRPRRGAGGSEISAAAGGPVELVCADGGRPSRSAVESRRDLGVPVAVEPSLDDEGEANIIGVVSRLVRAGAARIGVYLGDGRMAPSIDWIAGRYRGRVVGFFGAIAPDGATCFGVPVMTLDAFEDAGCEALVVPGVSVDVSGLVLAAAHGVPRECVHAAGSIPDELWEHLGDVAGQMQAAGGHALTTVAPGVPPGARFVSERELQHEAVAGGAEATVLLPGREDDFEVVCRLVEAGVPAENVISSRWAADELASPSRYASMARECEGERFALFGAGMHTRRLLRYAPSGTPRPALILDDNAAPGQRLDGVPVVAPTGAELRGIRSVILSSKAHEDVFHGRVVGLGGGVAVLRMYGGVFSGAA